MANDADDFDDENEDGAYQLAAQPRALLLNEYGSGGREILLNQWELKYPH